MREWDLALKKGKESEVNDEKKKQDTELEEKHEKSPTRAVVSIGGSAGGGVKTNLSFPRRRVFQQASPSNGTQASTSSSGPDVVKPDESSVPDTSAFSHSDPFLFPIAY